MDVQQPRRSLRAVVLPEVAGQRGDQLGAPLVILHAQLAQDLGGERPELGQVGDLQQQPVDAEIRVNTVQMTAEQAAERVVAYLLETSG